jgi:adenosylcobinamide-phosphate synthase
VVAPLFFALLGGAPLALAYKMVNTLDSMVGYRSPRYLEFGRAAARLDDIANFLPARLSVFLIAAPAAIFFRRGRAAWRTARRDGRRHLSPNAGWSEAAFAGALGVRLGGPNRYHGQMVNKPYIGAEHRSVQVTDIARACDLMLASALFTAVLAAGLALVLGGLR